MDMVSSLIERADRIAQARGWKRSSVSKRVLNDTYALDALANGKRRAWPETLQRIDRGLVALESEAGGARQNSERAA